MRRFPMKRINHQRPTAIDGACTNGAEEFFSRLRRMEIGHHHKIAGVYLTRYAAEAGWRDDHRREANGDQFRSIVGLVAQEQAERRFLRLLAAPFGGVKGGGRKTSAPAFAILAGC